jgi:glutamate racemase
MKIGVFDSGKGGTTVLSAIKKLLPDAEYYYIADSKNCPYGEKTNQELLKIVKDIVNKLIDWGANIIVVACNTATTKCIKILREDYPDVCFVGTEPAIKLASKTGAKKILVMATPGTIESERTAQLLVESEKPGQKIELLACPGLAYAIENNNRVDEVLSGLLVDHPKDYDAVVLGCTHYSLIKDKIQNHFKAATLIDGNDGVARRVMMLANQI